MNETEEDKKPESEQTSPQTTEAATEAVAPEKQSTADEATKESPPAEAKPAEAEAKKAAKEAPAEPAMAVQPTMKDKEPLNISEDKSWYVVHAFSNYEAQVKRALLERIERAGLGKFFGEILVPTEEVVEIRSGAKRKSERKFFPGYVLVQMDLNDETWHLVKDVPRVLGFIGGTADRPAPISDREADAILQRVQDGVDKPRPKVLFDVGEVVRVTDGPFNDFNGVVEEVNFEKNKLLVAVQIFGRSTPVELEFSQVEKA